MKSVAEMDAISTSGPTITFTISGEETNGQRFVESINAVLMRKGGILLETSRDLAKMTMLQIIHEHSDSRTTGRIVWVSPRASGRSQVLVDVKEATEFWRDVIADEVRAKAGRPEDSVPNLESSQPGASSQNAVSSAAPLAAQAAPAMEAAPRVAAPSPEPAQALAASLPEFAEFTGFLNRLVRSALEANLSPAIEKLTSEIRQDLAQVQGTVYSSIQETVQSAIFTFNRSIAKEADETAARNRIALDQKMQQVSQDLDQSIQFLQNELHQKVEEVVLLGKERLELETEAIVSRAGQAQSELTRNLDLHAETVTASIQERLQQQSDAMISRAGQAEMEWNQHLDRHAQEVKERCCSELKQSVDQTVEDSKTLFAHWSQEATDRVHESFLQNILGELAHEQEASSMEARRLLHSEAEQGVVRMRREIGRFVRELGESMEQRAEMLMETK